MICTKFNLHFLKQLRAKSINLALSERLNEFQDQQIMISFDEN